MSGAWSSPWVLLAILHAAVEKYVPVAEPSPFAKRWWTRELTDLQSNTEAFAA